MKAKTVEPRTYSANLLREFAQTISRDFSPSERLAWHDSVFKIYDRMRSYRQPYSTVFRELTIEVLPDVYSPVFFTDSFWFAERLPMIVGSTSLLEVGSGTGIIGLSCASNGAKLTMTDISESAVKNSQLNAIKNNVDAKTVRADIYDGLDNNDRFDYIFWAHPFNNWHEPVSDPLLLTGFDHGYRALERYLRTSRRFLNENGKLLLGTGDSADIRAICKICEDSELFLIPQAWERLPLQFGGTETIVYIIFEIAEKAKATM